METETQVNSRVESPNLPVVELKIEPKEETDSQFEFDQSWVASPREDEKDINYYEDLRNAHARKFDAITPHLKATLPVQYGNNTVLLMGFGLIGEFDSFCVKGSCSEYKTRIYKTETEESDVSLVILSESVKQEETHIKDEDEDIKLDIKNFDKESDNGVLLEPEFYDVTKQINTKNAASEELKYNKEESSHDEFYECALTEINGVKKEKLDKKTQKPEERQCPECPFKTIYRHSLKLHSTIHKKPDEINWYRCQECPYKTWRKTSLKIHVNIHNNLVLKCSKCPYETVRPTNLKRHQIKHKTEVEWLQCSECSYKTHLQSYLRKHSLIHKRDAFKCDKCPYQTGIKAVFKSHLVKHENLDKWYSCLLCSYKTPDKNGLRMHCKRRHICNTNNSKQIETYKCTECSYESGCRRSVKDHQLKHDPSNWLRCPDCTYKTPYKHFLKKHQLQHQEENVKCWHRCPECSYKNLDKVYLKKHLVSHKSADEIKWFECTECSFKAVQKSNLKQHELKHKEAHEVKWFYCYECSHKTKYKSSLVSHMSRHKKQIEK